MLNFDDNMNAISKTFKVPYINGMPFRHHYKYIRYDLRYRLILRSDTIIFRQTKSVEEKGTRKK